MSDLEVPGDGFQFSLFNYEVKFVEGDHVLLEKSQNAFVLGHHGEPQYNQLIELCCGLGGISSGAYYAGMHTLGGLDVSPWAVQVFNDNHSSPAILGDVKDPEKLRELFDGIGHRSVGFAMGFPCPPFSTRGDQLGFSDARAWTFVHGLDAAYLLRASFVLLERTPKVESFAQIVHFLDQFADTMGFKWTSQILHLDEAWPVRRTRWWCLLVPAALHPFLSLSDLPRASHLQSLSNLLPVWPQWPSVDLEDLIWTQQEVDFHEQYAVLSDLCIDLEGKCPTLLHSLGHLDRACPCGCRFSGLSHVRLSRDGISTVALQMPEWDGFRHLHPLEAAFLCTLSPNFCFRKLRAALPLVGQSAAPMQAHWMLSALLVAIQKWSGSQAPLMDLHACHRRFQQHLRQLAFHLWPSSANMIPRSVTLRFPQDVCIMFEVHAGLKLEHLIMAQRSIGGWLDDHEVRYQGAVVPPESFLQASTYDVSTPILPADSSGLHFVVRMNGRAWSGPFRPGLTVSALLATLGFAPSHRISLQVNGVDLPCNFHLTCSFDGLLRRTEFYRAGHFAPKGLPNFHLDAEAARLLRTCPFDARLQYLSALDLSNLVLLPPTAMHDALWTLLDPCAWWVFGFVCLEGHWTALSLDCSRQVFTYYDGLEPSADSSPLPASVQRVVGSMVSFFGLSSCSVRRHTLTVQTYGNHCGTIALANLGGFLGLWTSFSEDEACSWHYSLCSSEVTGAGAVEYTRAHGLLVQELPKHGVPPADAPARATLALKKLGTQPILQAFDAKHPWQALKAIGNSKDRPFQWVMHHELEKHIDAKALDKKAPMRKGPKQPSKLSPPVSLVPDQVQVPAGAFVDESGFDVGHLAAANISPTARGLVIVTHEQACRFLKDDKKLSVDALALLTLSPVEAPPSSTLSCSSLTWPGLLTATQEPLLIRGTCIQLGDVTVSPKVGSSNDSSLVETDLFRVFVYRDQWPSDWKTLTSGPLKTIITHFACLQFCDCSDVQCGKFHPAVEEVGISMVVLDAFAWKWLDGTGKTTQNHKAAAFSLMIRVPKSATPALLLVSGTDGLYTELRGSDTSSDDPQYAVVWLKDGYDAAVHRLRSLEKALHLVRFHAKYGLRCLKKDEVVLHGLVFPGRPFIDCGTSLQFEMGPWPYGISKQAIVDFLQSMPWVAKPLKPVRGSHDGRYWLLGSSVNPPAVVVNFAEQFLTITKVKDVPVSRPAPNVVASMKMLQKLTSGPSSTSDDPWILDDPWKGTGSVPVAAAPAASSKLDEMESRLASRLSEQLQEQVRGLADEPMDDSSKRMDQLEVNIQEMHKQQDKFTQWCHEAADKMTIMNQRVVQQEARMDEISQQVRMNRHLPLALPTLLDLQGRHNPFWTYHMECGMLQRRKPLMFQRFVRELKAFQAPSRNLRAAHGAFAPPRAGSRVAGSWTGVAQISDVPMRVVRVPWRGHEYASGRANLASFHFGSHCVLGAVLYAPPRGPTYGDARSLTAELLATITEEVVLGKQGPRYVAGDFNAAPGDHAAFQHWRSLGWQECQDLACSWFNRVPQNTCKASTRPDHIWLSPELQRWITNVTVNDEVFADHAVLQTHVSIPHDTSWQHAWHMPSVLPWGGLPLPLDFSDQVPFSWTPLDLTASFRTWSAAAEQELIQAVSSHTHVPRNCQVRGQTLDVSLRPISLVPIAPGPLSLAGLFIVVPLLPPSLAVAKALFLDFEANYRATEQWHLRQRTKIIQAKHFDHNKLLFKQLKPRKAGSVSHIRVTQEAQVTCVAGHTLELDSSLDFESAVTWTLDGLELQLASASPTSVTVVPPDDGDPPQVGSVLRATSFLTQFSEIERALHGLWDPIWRRHAGLADSHWDRIIAFGKAFLPGRPAQPLPWTSGRLSQAIRTYKPHATRGPDAWDPSDLAALSEVRLGDLASLFGLVESGMAWPQQLVTGFACPIAKCDQAELPTQFRPIVLLSLLYRVWASVSAKAFLPLLLSSVPEHVFGFIPGKRATDLCSLMQMAIDVAGACHETLVGYNADLIKCFNRLPRHPLLSLLEHLGLSGFTKVAWQNALKGLARRFRINADVGPARGSDTGFPEGDPLSCVAMLGFNLVFDAYVQQYAPHCIPWCFVDNLQLLSSTASFLHSGILVVDTFMEAWDLSLDPGKSFTWGTTTAQRAQLKALGHLVRLASKDLGAQMHYCQRPSREVLKQHLDSIGHFWTLLRHSTASQWFRRHAIRLAAWPKVLHSCESAWISESHLDSLRSKCMYALKWDRAGASPILRWALMQPLGNDPSFCQLWRVFESFWRLSRQFAFLRSAWSATVFTARFTNGFLHAFRAALSLLDWILDDKWILTGPWFSIPWDHLALEDLKLMLAETWQQVMCSRLGHRKDFQGLSTIDVVVSFQSFKTNDRAVSELVATIQDGTFCTNNLFSKFDPSKPATCAHCGQVDDLRHRCLHCPLLAKVRQQHVQAVAEWPLAGRAFTDHGLVERNPFLLQHWRNLLELEPTLEKFFVHPAPGKCYDVFTDETCREPRSRVKALAAWAVVDMSSNQILSRGLVPGLVQSSDIAELMAALSALLWALRYGVAICIHSDSSYVVDGLKVLRSIHAVPRQWKHQRIWKQVLDVVRQLDSAQWETHKIFSHCDYALAASDIDEWWILGNAKADTAAGYAFDGVDAAFWRIYTGLCAHHDAQVKRVQTQLSFLVAVAQFDFDHRNGEDVDDECLPVASLLVPRVEATRALVDQFELDVLEQLTESQTAPFPVQFGKAVLSFLLDLDMTATHARYVTGLELMAGFVDAGHSIPLQRFVDGRLVYDDPASVRAGGLVRITIATALQTFKRAVLQILRSADVQFFTQQTNRPDLNLFVNQWSFFIGWPDHVEAVVGPLVRGWFETRPHRRACDLAKPIP
eukprot:s564_g15.t1